MYVKNYSRRLKTISLKKILSPNIIFFYNSRTEGATPFNLGINKFEDQSKKQIFHHEPWFNQRTQYFLLHFYQTICLLLYLNRLFWIQGKALWFVNV